MGRVSGPRIVVAVEGISASGKSTLVARAARTFGWVALAEAYDRLDPRPDLGAPNARALAHVERTLLEEEGRRWRVARALSMAGETVVADTGFLGPLTYSWGLASLGRAPWGLVNDLVRRARRMAVGRRWGLPDAIVYLATRPATRARRSRLARPDQPAELAERHEAVGRLEERFYRQRLARLLPGRITVLDGEASVARVARALAVVVGTATPILRSNEGLLRVLASLEAARPSAAARPRRRRRATLKNSSSPARAPPR